MENKVKFDFLNAKNRTELEFGENTIIIKHLSRKDAEDLIAIQEFSIMQEGKRIEESELMLEVLKRTSNLDITEENISKLNKILKSPRTSWAELLVEELRSMILEVNKIKIVKTKNKIEELNQLVSNIKNSKAITDETKEFFHENQEILTNVKADGFVDSLRPYGLIKE